MQKQEIKNILLKRCFKIPFQVYNTSENVAIIESRIEPSATNLNELEELVKLLDEMSSKWKTKNTILYNISFISIMPKPNKLMSLSVRKGLFIN